MEKTDYSSDFAAGGGFSVTLVLEAIDWLCYAEVLIISAEVE